MRLVFTLFLTIVIAFTATAPTLAAALMGGDGCEGCACERVAGLDEGHEEESEGDKDCPPACVTRCCAPLRTALLVEPETFDPLPLGLTVVTVAPPAPLSPGEPSPVFHPPRLSA